MPTYKIPKSNPNTGSSTWDRILCVALSLAAIAVAISLTLAFTDISVDSAFGIGAFLLVLSTFALIARVQVSFAAMRFRKQIRWALGITTAIMLIIVAAGIVKAVDRRQPNDPTLVQISISLDSGLSQVFNNTDLSGLALNGEVSNLTGGPILIRQLSYHFGDKSYPLAFRINDGACTRNEPFILANEKRVYLDVFVPALDSRDRKIGYDTLSPSIWFQDGQYQWRQMLTLKTANDQLVERNGAALRQVCGDFP